MPYRFTHRRYSLPFRTPVRTAQRVWSVREGVVLRLESESGTVGFGEAAPIPWFGTETVEEIESACLSLGEKVTSEAAIPDHLGCLRVAWETALSAIETAAPRAGAPVVASPQQEYVSVAALLPAGRVSRERLENLVGAGFRTFKWKVGVLDAQDERGMLDDLLSALPSGSRVRLDANGAWDRRAAERWLSFCAERPVEFVEQPIAPEARGSEDLLLGLAGDYPVLLALDESVSTRKHLLHWMDLGWAGCFVLKPSLTDNLEPLLKTLSARNAAVVFSSALETAVGARSALRHAFAWTGEQRAVGFGVYPLFGDTRLNGPELAPFIRRRDLEQPDPEATWNALG